ncbi:MAG: zf-HC2 domain-containing protein [Casimicrobiaceae bacterium]
MFLDRLVHLGTCKEASRLLSQMQDRPLTTVERARLRLHLAICHACSRFAKQLEFVRSALARYRSDPPPPP